MGGQVPAPLGRKQQQHLSAWGPGSLSAQRRSPSLQEALSFLPAGINYCALNKPGCEHECVNTEESYYCRCRRGYTLDPNGRTCSRECAPGVWVQMDAGSATGHSGAPRFPSGLPHLTTPYQDSRTTSLMGWGVRIKGIHTSKIFDRIVRHGPQKY